MIVIQTLTFRDTGLLELRHVVQSPNKRMIQGSIWLLRAILVYCWNSIGTQVTKFSLVRYPFRLWMITSPRSVWRLQTIYWRLLFKKRVCFIIPIKFPTPYPLPHWKPSYSLIYIKVSYYLWLFLLYFCGIGRYFYISSLYTWFVQPF